MSLGLLTLLIVLLISGSNGSKKANPIYLPSYASNPNSEILFTQTGPIISNETHNYLQIAVTSSSVQFNLFQGYQNQVIASKIYNNNQQSYSAFLYALYYAGFNIGNNDPKLLNNTGYCSMGDLYTFELLNNNKVIQKYWTSNCSSVPGTYGGQSYNTINLFRTQVPDYSSMTSNARF